MADHPCFLGVELTGDRLVLALQDREAGLIGMVGRGFSAGDGRLHDPQDWWRALRTGIKDLLRRHKIKKSDLRGVGITGPDHGAACLDDQGRVLCQTPIAPNEEVDDWLGKVDKAVGRRNLANLTGAGATPGCLAAQLLWLRANHKRVWHDLAQVLQPRDFLRFRLTDTTSTDPSTAAATRLFSLRNRAWSAQVLERLDLPGTWFPQVAHGPVLAGRITPQAARDTGLAAGTPVAVGASRDACLAIAAGATDPGHGVVELGDRGSLILFTDKTPRPKRHDLQAGCFCAPGVWTLTLPGATSCDSFDWFTRQLSAGEIQQWRRSGRSPLEVYAEYAAETPPGAAGVHYIPQVDGHHAHAGAYIGLRHRHGRGHLLRSMFEGGALYVREVLASGDGASFKGDRLKVIGGGTDVHLWCQILADAANVRVRMVDRPHPAAQGAALLAAVAVGAWKDLREACRQTAKARTDFRPRKAATGVYEKALAEHRNWREHLLPEAVGS